MVFPAVTMEGILLLWSYFLLSGGLSNDDDGAVKGPVELRCRSIRNSDLRSVGSVFCFGRFGRGSVYALVLILQGARGVCPSVCSSRDPYYWGTLLLCTVDYCMDDIVCLVWEWCGVVGVVV